MRIYELKTTKTDWDWDFTGSEEMVANFTIGNIPYRFNAYSNPEYPYIWEVEFGILPDHVPSDTYKSRFGITGTGNSAAVFSTVLSIINELLTRRPEITILQFSAEEPSRRSLYKKLLAKYLPSWSIEQQDGKYITAVSPKHIDNDQE